MKTLSVAVLSAALALFGFAEDAYIESDGTQALDTGYYVTAKTKIEADFQFTKTRGQDTIFGAYSGKDLGVRFYIGGGYDTAGANWSFIYGYNNGSDPGWYNILSKDTVRRTAMIDFEHLKAEFAGKTGNLDASVVRADKTNSVSLAIFAQKTAKGAFSEKSSIKLYSFKIWEAGVPVRDYVPCAKTVIDSTNGVSVVYGLYDKIGKSFVGSNNMTSGFAAGGDGIMQFDDSGDCYIESDGTDFMNLRAKFGPDTRLDCDFQLCEYVVQRRLVGVSSDGNTIGELYLNGGGSYATGIGDTPLYARATSFSGKDLKRHTYVLDRPANVSYLVTDGAQHDVVTLTQTSGQYPGGETTKTSLAPMVVFGGGNNANGWSATALTKMRVYGVKVYEKGVLTHDYRPVVKGGVPGFKDEIDGVFITGEHPTAFTASANVPVVPDDGAVALTGDPATKKRYFDTGYTVKSTSRIELDYALIETCPSTAVWDIMSCHGDSSTSHEQIRVYYADGYIKYRLGWNYTYSTSISFDKDVRRTVVMDVKNKQMVLENAGYTNLVRDLSERYDGGTFNTHTLKVAAIWDGGSCFSPIRVYGLKIFENDKLVCSYVPTVKDGLPALKETLGGTFLTTSPVRVSKSYCEELEPSGDIAVEPDSAGAYLESTGAQAINTGYFLKSNTRIECDYQFMKVMGQMRVFGANLGDPATDLAVEHYVGGTRGSAGANASFIYGAVGATTGTYNIENAGCERRLAMIDFGARTYSYGSKSGSLDATARISGTAGSQLVIFSQPGNTTGGIATSLCAAIRLYSFRIYEGSDLVHYYLPYKNGTTVGLKDVVTGDILTDAVKSATPFKIGGVGYDESDSAFYTQPQDVTVAVDGTKTLSAYAPGAISYQWYKNGEPIEGATGMALDVTWEKLKAPRTVIYTVKAKFDRYGVEIERESDPATVTMQPLGLFLIVQ